ncbi:helix-turn-helix domain-containing protein [Spirillospora sp. CA-294931]|uniref:helix-turn-helix domain-containing protein n=1 Tax=Spirillospora sp. CA-294931 TaxID=3240042 RepID=UPI003D93C591
MSDVGNIIRSARAAIGWTQTDLAQRLHCSRSTVSRLETGATAPRDLDTLRRLAAILKISPPLLGITTTVTTRPPAETEDDVRRRQLLTSIAVTAAAGPLAAHATQPTAARLLLDRVRDAMLGTGPRGAALATGSLPSHLNAAIRAYDASQWSLLADLLPRLITSGHDAGAQDVLAQTYILTTRLLIKLDDQLGWMAADRARTFADHAGHPLIAAEAARNLAVLARRAGWHSQAADIVLAAAGNQDLQGADPAHTAERGLLVMSAAYTAAHAGDRAEMRALTHKAAAIAAGLGPRAVLLDQGGGGFSTAAVQLHLISAEYAAGDPAAAIDAARRVDPRRLPSVERKVRFHTDVARAFGMWGRRDQCLAALLTAERIAPEETHGKPAVRELVAGLLASGRATPELRGLASRCRVR